MSPIHNKKEFVQKYVLRRVTTIKDRVYLDSAPIAQEALRVWAYIEEQCADKKPGETDANPV